jgi:hypothetical protein
MCLYRGPNGTKCFAGALLPDELYDPEFEGIGITSSHPSEVSRIFSEIVEDLALLQTLQAVHDTVDPGNWERSFLMIADQNGLQYAPPVIN